MATPGPNLHHLDPLLRQLLPNVDQNVLFDFAGSWSTPLPGLRPRRPGPFAVGAVTKPLTTRLRHDAIDVLGVAFQPGCAAFPNATAERLTDRAMPLELLWGRAATQLYRGLGAQPSNAARLHLLEDALAAQLPPPDERAQRVQAAAADLQCGTRGPGVDSLGTKYGTSRQHLTREFRRLIGMPPSVFIRIARFHRLLKPVAAGLRGDWATWAARFGYADQAHLIREFRRMVGVPPGQFARQLAEFRSQVPSVQSLPNGAE